MEVEERLLRHQYPRQVEILGELPKNEAGEVLRGELRGQPWP